MDDQTKARLALALPLAAMAVVIGFGWSHLKEKSAPVAPSLPAKNQESSLPEKPARLADLESPEKTITQTPPKGDANPDLEIITPELSIDLGNGETKPIEIPEPTYAPIAHASVETLNQADHSPEADLAFIQDALNTYRAAFHENPFGGENEEIVAGLTGRNARGLVVLPPDHPAINQRGQLLDRWGTPYFFHPVSRDEMDVTSAGPDHQLFTGDDVRLDLNFE
ncbi:MAG: hypothetical protein KDN19_00165 [Verrucomicrobiae bacterium]|nr:hypothetical protein [Verrucomicrobiae bacterium]